jgi:hypothetical protein
VLVATKAKSNRDMNSPLNREFYKSFLDVSLSMYLLLQKFLYFHVLIVVCLSSLR